MNTEPRRDTLLAEALALGPASQEPPPDLLPQLLRAVPPPQLERATRREPLLWLLGAAAVAALLLWLLFGWGWQPPGSAAGAAWAAPLLAAAALHLLWPRLSRRAGPLLAALLVSGSAQAQSAPAPLSLQPLLQQLAAQDLQRGAVAVQLGDGPLVEQRIGGGVVEPYRIGSISKTFTAVLALQLVEQGRLALADPVSRWFPKLPGASHITVEMLLRHRSGLAEISQARDFHRWALKPRSMAELQALIEALPVGSTAGESARYNNTGFILLHWIVERAGGAPYDSLLERGITGPLGLVHTRMAQPGAGLPSFQRDGERWVPMDASDPSVPLGAGALVSTPAELVRFARALFAGRLLKPETVARMSHLLDGFGQGLTPVPKAGRWAMQGLGHEGVIDGFRSVLVHLPQHKLTAAVLLNGEHWPRDALLEAVLASRLDPGRGLPDLTPQRQRWAIEFDPMGRGLPAGARFALRGSQAPLSWQRGWPLQRGAGAADGLWRTTLEWQGIAGLPLETKFVIEDASGQVLAWEGHENRRWFADAPAPGVMRWDVKGEAERIWAEVLAADTALFDAFNRQDAAAMAPYFSDRLEFFHDRGGISGKAQSMRKFAQNFERGLRIRRERVAAGTQVYPVPGVGAMQIGQHRFCRRDGSAADAPEQCETFGFSQVWEHGAAGWQLLRVMSYAH